MTASKFSIETLRSLVSAATVSGKDFVLNRSAVIEVLQAFIAEAVSSQNVAEWADFFDVNEDVELESDALLPDVLFELSSPEINGELDVDRARKLVLILSNTNGTDS
ncbi:hypothetical protein [Dyella nitratireducens]|uniref:Restriction endonuclease n=1 Tax=Dyella nitratireducens TaxID=1849580 RepID=A0ABQ1GBG8_9GAMM|nr:hypothetical protein [Dyella nitratireducens]GGA40373.1 hypothetical protein GCM10010981_32040 [Dyella nitratireducens]GLQ40562.1 hypothetical protein GCM10007902_04110 [Dyella nitratireducens]